MTTQASGRRAAEVKRALRKLECVERKWPQGTSYHVVDSSGQVLVPPIFLPKLSDVLPQQVLARIHTCLVLSDAEADQLFNCTMTRAAYLELRKKRTKGHQS